MAFSYKSYCSFVLLWFYAIMFFVSYFLLYSLLEGSFILGFEVCLHFKRENVIFPFQGEPGLDGLTGKPGFPGKDVSVDFWWRHQSVKHLVHHLCIKRFLLLMFFFLLLIRVWEVWLEYLGPTGLKVTRYAHPLTFIVFGTLFTWLQVDDTVV